MKRLSLALTAVLLGGTSVNAAIPSSESARLASATRIVQDLRANIPEDYWARTRCAVVIPELKKAAFILGGEWGKGVMSCRSGDRWSPPVFMQLAKGSVGFQIGGEAVDLVLLVMNDQGAQKLLDNKVNLGADASVAAGPIGRTAAAGTDAYLKAEIVSYSRAHGLFAGLDISGGALRPDDAANEVVYGVGARPRTILASRDIAAPTEASTFLDALNASDRVATSTAADRPDTASATRSGAASRVAPTPTTTVQPTTDSDLRARVIDVQQSLDRLLSETSTSPVGTSGTSSATVTVDRARLTQIRQQLEAILMALDKR
jgi:lipid-binding SYLF domain-containing protein